MRWKLKARIQNLVARLPANLSYPAYYFIQRRFGALRKPDPRDRLPWGVAVLDHIGKQGRTVRGANFLEVGTGWRLNVPIALWLGGAAEVTTVDLNPYLKADLVLEDVRWMENHPHEIRTLFGRHSETPVFLSRFDRLINSQSGLEGLLEMMNIHYLAPADAARLTLPSQSIDYHVSCAVFEHVPADVLEDILREGKRILNRGGLFVHFVDFGDHFADCDPSISTMNFLRFDEDQWQGYAGNRYMYHNRLRVDDFVDLYRKAGLTVSVVEPEIDQRALRELREGFPLNERFVNKSQETNAAMNAWMVGSFDPPIRAARGARRVVQPTPGCV